MKRANCSRLWGIRRGLWFSLQELHTDSTLVMLVTFLHALIKYWLTFGSWFEWRQATGKAWYEEHDVAGHHAAMMESQREMNAGAQFTFSSYPSQDPSPWMVLSTFGMVLPPLGKFFRRALVHVPRGLSPC